MGANVPKNMWAILDGGRNIASVRVPMGGKAVNLPLILTSRANARLVMKAYPELSPRNTIRKMKNGMVAL